MQAITVSKQSVPMTFRVAPPTDLLRTLSQSLDSEEVPQVTELLKLTHTWYSLQNEWRAQTAVEALELAAQVQLPVQIKLYTEQVLEWVTKDMAEQAYHLAVHELGYRGEIACRHYNLTPGQRWRELITSTGQHRQEWIFDPVEQFANLMPLHALKAIQLLAQAGMQPTAYWVADKVETVLARSRSLDPILCAQFGPWVAGLAFWV